MQTRPAKVIEDEVEADLSIWKEALFAVELFLLHASPVYYGLGVPHGDGSGVVIIPGFLGSDHYLAELRYWVASIGYEPYFSGISLNAECPNLLIQYRLDEIVTKAVKSTGRKIHLIGHSLGGIIARSIAGQRPNDIASVITLASPFRGTIAHRTILRAADVVRKHIIREHGSAVLPHCYTARCTCNFLDSLRRKVPESVLETAIYTLDDGVVDPRFCRTDNSDRDFQVSGTHIGLAFNASVYKIIAERLALACSRDKAGK